MTRTAILRTVAFVLSSATVFACGTESVAPPDVPEVPAATPTAKVNGLLAELGSSQSAAASAQAAGGTPTPTSSSSTKDDAGQCAIDLTNKRFNCPERTLPNGMKITMYFQLLDANGEPQPAFDTVTTVAIRQVSDQTGTIQQPLMTPNGPVPATQTMNSHTELTLSGIKTGPRRHNGTGTMSNTIVPEGMPTAVMSGTTTFANIEFGTDTTKRYPIGGTISATIKSTTGTQPEVTTTQVTTYDGTAIAKTVITLPNGSKRTCTFDMSKPPGEGAPPNCVNG